MICIRILLGLRGIAVFVIPVVVRQFLFPRVGLRELLQRIVPVGDLRRRQVRRADKAAPVQLPKELKSNSMGGVRSSHVLHLVSVITPRSRRRQRFAIGAIQSNRLLDDMAQLFEHLFFIIAVSAAVNQAGRAADIALILFRPFDDLCVTGTFFHDFDSLIACCTART